MIMMMVIDHHDQSNRLVMVMVDHVDYVMSVLLNIQFLLLLLLQNMQIRNLIYILRVDE